MKIYKQFVTLLVSCIGMFVIYIVILQRRPNHVIILRETEYGKYCLEENICKDDINGNVFTYIRLSSFNTHLQEGQINSSPINSRRVVPNIVHYTWYDQSETGKIFRFHHMVAVLSAHKFIKPSRIYFWHEVVPTGDYWKELTEKVPELFLVFRKAPTHIYGSNVSIAENDAALVRLEAVLEYGGMYFDLDVMVLKPLDPLLVYDVVMGYETPWRLCNGIIIGKAWAEFLKIWHREFQDPRLKYNSAEMLARLAQVYPNLIHTETTSFHRPNRFELDKLYKEGNLYDWKTENYACHLWSKFYKIEHNIMNIKEWNTTVGEIWRWILFDEWRSPLPKSSRKCIYDNLCKERNSDIVWKYIRNSDFVEKLEADIDLNVKITHSEVVVPNIVHFAWYVGDKKNRNTFRFHHVLAILAVHKFIKPKIILFWHDMIPEGPYWEDLKDKVPELNLVYREAPKEIRGRKVALPEHLTDVVRLEAVMEYGGIYLDLDVMVVKSLEPLLKYDVTMGYETPEGLCNGIIIGKPWAEFFRIWHREYNTFDDKNWAYHSVTLPALLAKNHSSLIHTESKSMHRPNWRELPLLYQTGKLYDWRKNNYAVHLWIRKHKREHDATDIKTWNTTVGEIFRYIYYDDWRVIS